MVETKFMCDYAKRASACKKCKGKLEKGVLRIAKVVPNHFNDGDGEMKMYHHAACLIESMVKARANTKIIEEVEDIEGFSTLTDEDRRIIATLVDDLNEKREKKSSPTKKPRTSTITPKKISTNDSRPTPKVEPKVEPSEQSSQASQQVCSTSKTVIKSEPVPQSSADDTFRAFRRLCANLANESSYKEKSQLIRRHLAKGVGNGSFTGDTYLLLKHLLPGVVKVVYNLKSKQLVKLFSLIFASSQNAMMTSLEQGDVAETVREFFETSKIITPLKKSDLTLQEVDMFLLKLSEVTKEEDQQRILTKITKRSTGNDLKMIIRLIKHDLRINAGAKHILDGLDDNAYSAFQVSHDLEDVVRRVKDKSSSGALLVKASVLTPVLPMLAEACKSTSYAFKKCPAGMYAEIKYDGERVQVHKSGKIFQYFSRSLKPVTSYKVSHFEKYINQAFPGSCDLILDSEVLLIDNATGKPLPFGSLGIHKKKEFSDANVCLFVFDCLHYNDESLMKRPLKERREFLRANMTEIPNRIMFSEMHQIGPIDDPASSKTLYALMMRVFAEGLEGLVMKDIRGIYEPGKRHWLKVKRDYLGDGEMADSADLVVLGGYYGSGSKGGLMSSFLLGVYCPNDRNWKTVTKCSGGFDDKTLRNLMDELKVNKISKDFSKVPNWLEVSRSLVPDLIVKDPKESPVWEITGAEFSKADGHTADGISIRFPRCTKVRNDKTWKEATDLPRLKVLYELSKEKSDLALPASVVDISPQKKRRSGDSSPVKASSPMKKIKLEPTSPVKHNSITDFIVRSPKKLNSNQSSSSKKIKTETKDILPDVFKGIKFYLDDAIKSYSTLRRYIIAYHGAMVDRYSLDTADYVIRQHRDKNSNNVKEVSKDWLIRCIKDQYLYTH